MSVRHLDVHRPGGPSGRSNFVDRTVGAVWRAFDFQLATYAALLLCFGLAMAYSNTVSSGSGIFDASSTFLRALMWTAIALAVFLTDEVPGHLRPDRGVDEPEFDDGAEGVEEARVRRTARGRHLGHHIGLGMDRLGDQP